MYTFVKGQGWVYKIHDGVLSDGTLVTVEIRNPEIGERYYQYYPESIFDKFTFERKVERLCERQSSLDFTFWTEYDYNHEYLNYIVVVPV